MTAVSPPSNRETISRAASPSGDSLASSKAPSRTTPEAPAATHPEADSGPIPPRTHARTAPSASTPCRRMNDESSPQRPPAS